MRHRPPFASDPAATATESGFSFVEMMIALVLVLFVMLSIAQLFGVGIAVNQASEDITQVTSLASEKIEDLKYRAYDDLTAGGDLDANAAGYFDEPDLEGDGDIDYVRRWSITDNGTSKTIQVRVIAQTTTTGITKETTVGTLLADR